MKKEKEVIKLVEEQLMQAKYLVNTHGKSDIAMMHFEKAKYYINFLREIDCISGRTEQAMLENLFSSLNKK